MLGSPKAYRAGMLSARRKVTARCAKSRHTPARFARTSTAVPSGLVRR